MVAKPLQMVWKPLLRFFMTPNTPLKIFLKKGTVKSGNIVTLYKLCHHLAKILGHHKICSFRDIYFSQKHFDIKIFLFTKLVE